MTIYVTRAGDSVAGVARGFGVEPAHLAQLNQLSDPSRLTAGLALLIPSSEPLLRRCAAELNICAACAVRQGALSQLLPKATYLCSFSAQAQPEGAVSVEDDGPLLQAAYAHRALPLLTVSNYSAALGGFSAETAHRLLSEEGAQSAFFDSLLKRMEERPYGGAAFDLQYIYPFEREAYSRLLCRAAHTLHPRGAYLFAFAPPKTEDDEYSLISGGCDYAALGQYCDRVILHFSERSGGQPPAVSRTGDILDYAAGRIPAGKILPDISLRGGCGVFGGEARSISPAAAAELAVSVGAEVKYEPLSQTARFTYKDALGRPCRVWFEDIRSTLEKLRLAQLISPAGLSIWCAALTHRPTAQLITAIPDTEKIL